MNENINNIVNEEVMEATKCVKFAEGVKIAAMVTIGCVFAYRYILKPIITKIKDKKAQQEIDGEIIDLKEDEFKEIE